MSEFSEFHEFTEAKEIQPPTPGQQALQRLDASDARIHSLDWSVFIHSSNVEHGTRGAAEKLRQAQESMTWAQTERAEHWDSLTPELQAEVMQLRAEREAADLEASQSPLEG